jgi:uncharacterized protein
MQPIPLNLSEADLTALDAFLMSERSPEESMLLSDLDGFLTAIAVGPELVTPSEWMPIIWRWETPEFDSETEMQTVLGAILARYNEIVHGLNQDEPVCEPLYWEGFLEGVDLRRKAWEPIFADPDAGIAMLPIIALCSDEHGDSLLDLDDEQENAIAADVPELIPECVVKIHGFWKRHYGRKIRPGASPKPGRNAPCPCGSGRKFKNCCAIG